MQTKKKKKWLNTTAIGTVSFLSTMYNGVTFTSYNKGESSFHVVISESA
jgi:hypothetical protein